MESVVRALVVYVLLLALFRVAGKRTLANTTSFDLVLLLIISEAIQNGLTGSDYSITNAVLIVVTLILADIGLSLVKRRSPRLEALIDGLPLLLFRDGRPIDEPMARERVDMDDILAAARERHGIGRVEDIGEAILERSGEISVIPRLPQSGERRPSRR
jgi:uncharacterized membrane protein YcaP (DUF421 family)